MYECLGCIREKVCLPCGSCSQGLKDKYVRRRKPQQKSRINFVPWTANVHRHCVKWVLIQYYTDIGYLIYTLLYDANIFFEFIITYPMLSQANIIGYGTNISDVIYCKISEICCSYPILNIFVLYTARIFSDMSHIKDYIIMHIF